MAKAKDTAVELDAQPVAEPVAETTPKKTATKSTKTVKTIEPKTDVSPEVDPEPAVTTTVHINVHFSRVDRILAELKTKPLAEALKVDPEIDALFTANGDVIARESRNSFYVRFKDGVDAKKTPNSDGIWTQPVSYSIS